MVVALLWSFRHRKRARLLRSCGHFASPSVARGPAAVWRSTTDLASSRGRHNMNAVRTPTDPFAERVEQETDIYDPEAQRQALGKAAMKTSGESTVEDALIRIAKEATGADVLIGKAQPTAAVATFFDEIPAAGRPAAASRVQFIADSRPRLDELAALARHLGLTLRISVEIDVGLRRSGVPYPHELPNVLSGLVENSDVLRFTGFLGYDGHVAHVPVLFGSPLDAVTDAWRKAMAIFESFIDILRVQFPELMRDDLVFNSGGSASYPMYQSGPVNDVAIGGGVVRPAAYPDVFCGVLQPAIFIATQVLAHYPLARLPFLSAEFSARLLRYKQGFTIYGGGWAAHFVSPAGLESAPLVSDPENQNLVPNQSLLTAPQSITLAPGDWIFMHPKQSDALFQFEEIMLVRGGRLQEERWGAFPRRY